MGQRVKVLAGDFLKVDGEIGWGSLYLAPSTPPEHGSEFPSLRWGQPGMVKIPLTALASVEVATEESVKRAGGTIGWGAAGAVLLGPVGLLAGVLLGGRGKDITFVARFRDGRKVLATTNTKGYQELLAATFK